MDLVALEGSKGPVPYASVASPTSRAPWSNMVMTQYGPQEPGLPISNQYQINQQPAVISLSPLEQHPLFPDKKSDLEEKVEVRGEIRWLQDPTGRLCGFNLYCPIHHLSTATWFKTKIRISIQCIWERLARFRFYKLCGLKSALLWNHRPRFWVPTSRRTNCDIPFRTLSYWRLEREVFLLACQID